MRKRLRISERRRTHLSLLFPVHLTTNCSARSDNNMLWSFQLRRLRFGRWRTRYLTRTVKSMCCRSDLTSLKTRRISKGPACGCHLVLRPKLQILTSTPGYRMAQHSWTYPVLSPAQSSIKQSRQRRYINGK